MQGKKVICKSTICFNEEGGLYDFTGGIKIKLNDADLAGYYSNTAASRKALKAIIQAEK